MKQISISDFRAHIGQHLDELSISDDKNNLIQVGDLRNDVRIFACSQSTFHHHVEQYYILHQYQNCLRAMNLKTMATLIHAPALKDMPLSILNSLCTLFEMTQNVFDIVLQQYPYPIFDTLDMRPICSHQMSAKAPLSLYTFARFIQNTYDPIATSDEPITIHTVLDCLFGDGDLNFKFSYNIVNCTAYAQRILKEAITAVYPLLYFAVRNDMWEDFIIQKLLDWYAKYIGTDIPMYGNGCLWTMQYPNKKP